MTVYWLYEERAVPIVVRSRVVLQVPQEAVEGDIASLKVCDEPVPPSIGEETVEVTH